MTFPFMKLSKDFALDDNAAALPSAKLYIYNAGTTTPRTIYSNAAGSATHTNPLIADAAGRFATWFLDPDGGDYKEVLKDTDGVTIYTVDNLPVTPITATAETTPTAPSTPVESATSSFTLGVGDVSKVWNIDPTSGDVTVTLTAATGVDDGLWALIRHKGTAGRVIITDGTPNKIRRVLDVPGESVVIVSDNVNWYTISEAGEVRLPAQGWVTCADYTTTPPSGPTAGTKYLAAVGASSPWTEKRIYEANGVGGWTEFVPEAGWCAYVQDENVLYVFNGSNWTAWTNVTAPTATYLGRALFREEQAQNTAGGTPTANAWTKATLNTTISNNITGVSISSSVVTFTGVTGKFLIRATKSFFATTETQIRLRDTTNSVNLGVSPQLYAANYTSGTGPASILSGVSPVVSGVIDLTGTTTNIELQYYVTSTGGTSGLGRVRNVSGENEVYGQLEILDLTAQQGPAGSTGATGSGYGGTSTSSVAIGSSGTKTWTTQSGYAYVTGQRVRVAYDASNYIEGTVSSYSGTTFSITADRSVGSGTYTSWTIGAAGDVGATGTAGATGAAGAHSFDFTFDTGTSAADPGSGKVRANNANLASATALYINETDRLGVSQATAIAQWDDSTSTVRGFLTLVDLATPANKVRYSISGTNTDNGSYDTVNVTYVSGVTSLSAVNIAILFEPKGDQGTAGSGSGDLLSTNNLSDVASRATSRQNLGVKFVELEDYGGAADGTTDNTTPLNNAMAALSGLGIRNIRLRPGTYRFASKPSDLTLGVIIEGQGPSNTFIKRDYSGASSTTGFLVWSGSGANGGGIRDCQVYAATGTTTGAMLKFYTGAADPAGYQIVDNVVVTYNGTGTYDYSLLADGVLNTTSGSQGIRDLRILDTFLFKGASGTDSARFVNSTNLQTHGLWANGNVTVTGGGTATSNTTNANIDMICLAQLFVSEAKYITARGSVDTVNFSTNSQQCTWLGVVQTTSGGIADTGTDNVILNYNALGVAYGGTGARTASAARTNLGLVIGTDVQAYDADLAALAANSSNGLWARTGAGTGSARTITAPAAGITVSNGDGVSGNPTLALANDLSAVEGLASNGIATRTATDTWTARTITGTSAEITVTNGDGVSGNPTLSLPTALTFTGKTVTGGTFNVALGSVSAPSLSFSGDTDTGIYSSGANLLDFATAGVRRAGFTGSTMQFGVIASQAGALISVRDNAAALEWGHQNSAGYLCVLGNETGSGKPFMAWNCYAGTTANTYHTLGIAGVVFLSGNDGSVSVNAITNTSADNQSPTEFLSLGTGGVLAKAALGYKTGVGGSVTQATSRSTGVTINTPTGAITLVSAAGSTTATTFTVTNSYVAATDTIILGQKSGTDKYILLVTNVAAGSFAITAYTTGGTTTEQPVINFAVLKAVAS